MATTAISSNPTRAILRLERDVSLLEEYQKGLSLKVQGVKDSLLGAFNFQEALDRDVHALICCLEDLNMQVRLIRPFETLSSFADLQRKIQRLSSLILLNKEDIRGLQPSAEIFSEPLLQLACLRDIMQQLLDARNSNMADEEKESFCFALLNRVISGEQMYLVRSGPAVYLGRLDLTLCESIRLELKIVCPTLPVLPAVPDICIAIASLAMVYEEEHKRDLILPEIDCAVFGESQAQAVDLRMKALIDLKDMCENPDTALETIQTAIANLYRTLFAKSESEFLTSVFNRLYMHAMLPETLNRNELAACIKNEWLPALRQELSTHITHWREYAIEKRTPAIMHRMQMRAAAKAV